MDDINFDFESKEQEVEAKKGKLRRIRSLKQYRDLSDEEFDKVITQKALGIEVSQEFEKRIAEKLEEFENDYDLSDLKINDRDNLRALIQAQISLEDLEQALFKLRAEGINQNYLVTSEKLSKAMSDLRADISKLQTDLNITRKMRKSDRDVSVMAYLDDLKAKAKEFAEMKMQYIFCPKCNMLLGTVWATFPENERNKIAFVCGRTLGDGSKCGEKVVTSTAELLKNRGTNKPEITPESML